MDDKPYEVEKQEAQTPEHVERTHTARVFTPRVDILESQEEITLTADMPGVDEGSVDITLEKGVLTVRGEVTDHQPEGHSLVYREYETGNYERAFTLSEEVDQNGIAAAVKDGVLTVTLPKTTPEPARRIEVKGE